MPPFASAAPPMLQVHAKSQSRRPADNDLDFPVESVSDMSLHDEAADTLPTLPKPTPLRLAPRPYMSPRSSTDPSPSAPLLQGYLGSMHRQQPPTASSKWNRSPYSRSHLRSRSTGAALLSAPVMTRAHSMPNPHISGLRTFDPANSPSAGSPMRSPARVRSPFKFDTDSAYAPPPRSPSFATTAGAIESIQEDSELDITPRSTSGPLPHIPAMASFARSSSLRRRPASPLRGLQNPFAIPTSYPASVIDSGANIQSSACSSAASSPKLGPMKGERFNEAYPSLHHYASTSSFSSIPSTPSSARSRSPSISSLETIEDAPDLESEAIEAEHIERLKLAAERQERIDRGEDPDDGPRRRSLDGPRSGFGRVGRERKRWSICGGERRADLDLETIWED